MIWNLWEISAVLAGSRDLPDTNLMKSTRSSLENSSSVCQNHCTSWCCSSTSRYRTTFFKTSTEISGIPHTICSSCFAVRRDNSGTGTIHDIPSRTAATCSQERLFIQHLCADWAPMVKPIGLGTSGVLICSQALYLSLRTGMTTHGPTFLPLTLCQSFSLLVGFIHSFLSQVKSVQGPTFPAPQNFSPRGPF